MAKFEKPVPTLQFMFTAFCKFGGESLTAIRLSICDMWMDQADLFNKNLTRTDTGIVFNRFKKRSLSYHEFVQYLDDLAATKGLNADELKTKLTNAGMPGSKAT